MPNLFGLIREYTSHRFPAHDPDEKITTATLLKSMNPYSLPDATSQPRSPPSYYPYPNWSAFRLGSWYWMGSAQKTQNSFQDLLELLMDPNFHCADLVGVNWKVINQKLAEGEARDPADLVDEDLALDNWCESPVTIPVPIPKRSANPGIFHYEASSLWHRKILEVIRTKLTDPEGFANFHLEPYHLFWNKTGTTPPIRVYGEAYSSKRFIDAHEELQRSPPEPGCKLQRAVVALMFASDETQLTNFGRTQLWPLYMAFGNESKYRRSEFSCRAFEHIAYFEKVRLISLIHIVFRWADICFSYRQGSKTISSANSEAKQA